MQAVMLDSTLPGGALQSQKGKQHVPIRSIGSSQKQLPDAKNTTFHPFCVVLQGLCRANLFHPSPFFKIYFCHLCFIMIGQSLDRKQIGRESGVGSGKVLELGLELWIPEAQWHYIIEAIGSWICGMTLESFYEGDDSHFNLVCSSHKAYYIRQPGIQATKHMKSPLSRCFSITILWKRAAWIFLHICEKVIWVWNDITRVNK